MFILLAELALFGSALWFWLIFALLSGMMFWFLEDDRHFWGLGSIIVFVLLFAFFGSHNPFIFIASHAIETVIMILSFFAIGTVWAIVKWWFHVNKAADRYVEFREKWLESHNVKNVTRKTLIPDDLKGEWWGIRTYDRYYRYVNLHDPVLKARDNRSRIMSWMCYWPFSMVWTLINDPIRAIYRRIYRVIQGWLQAISERAFSKVGAIADAEELPGKKNDDPDSPENDPLFTYGRK